MQYYLKTVEYSADANAASTLLTLSDSDDWARIRAFINIAKNRNMPSPDPVAGPGQPMNTHTHSNFKIKSYPLPIRTAVCDFGLH